MAPQPPRPPTGSGLALVSQSYAEVVRNETEDGKGLTIRPLKKFQMLTLSTLKKSKSHILKHTLIANLNIVTSFVDIGAFESKDINLQRTH